MLEEQIHDQDMEVSKAKNVAKKKQDQMADLEEELLDYKKVDYIFPFFCLKRLLNVRLFVVLSIFK